MQGFGNVGSVSAELMAERGFRICAVSDVAGGIYNPAGLDVPALLEHRRRTGCVAGFPGSRPITNSELLELPVDVLVPAALENQITARNAGRIQASVIIEGANGPTTPDADLILEQRGIVVVPDILANAGGVTVSYFEWVQDLQSFFWEEGEINRQLERIIKRAFAQMCEQADLHQVSLRLGRLPGGGEARRRRHRGPWHLSLTRPPSAGRWPGRAGSATTRSAPPIREGWGGTIREGQLPPHAAGA